MQLFCALARFNAQQEVRVPAYFCPLAGIHTPIGRSFICGGGFKERVTNFNFDLPTFTLIARCNGLTSAPIRCDHCRGRLGFRVHRFWHMQFCSATCKGEYQKRLSPDTREKVLKIDVVAKSWKFAS
jgi:hypothetical protein